MAGTRSTRAAAVAANAAIAPNSSSSNDDDRDKAANGMDAMDTDNAAAAPDQAKATSATSYEEIMGIIPKGEGFPDHPNDKSPAMAGGGAQALSQRLAAFREWINDETEMVVHPSVCVVNGEATDGTKNAPMWSFASTTAASGAAASASASSAGRMNGSAAAHATGHLHSRPAPAADGAIFGQSGRVGLVDGVADRALYERTMGCQIRAVKEIRKDEVLMTVPRSAFITPDVVAGSDAGRAILACCESPPSSTSASSSSSSTPSSSSAKSSFWDVFENTTVNEEKFQQKIARNSGTQLLIKILQERKRAETAFSRRMQDDSNVYYTLAPNKSLSTRTPFLAFLIHQRFSPTHQPLVTSGANNDFQSATEKSQDQKSNALHTYCQNNATDIASSPIKLLPGTPKSYGPYARVLPSSVSLPICWKRHELALLAGCIPGAHSLQEVAAGTMQLADEFTNLIDAGILHRFPHIFPPGLITWERWVWAASVFISRVLPVSCYLDKGDEKASASQIGASELQSPREIWDELGVMIPLLDMANHESETNQVTWQPKKNAANDNTNNNNNHDDDDEEPHEPRAIAHKRIKKGAEIFLNYGAEKGNDTFILQYGFAQMNNRSDEVKLGWGLMDAVGNVTRPSNYDAPFDIPPDETYEVFESVDSEAINRWWTADRLLLLEQEAMVDANFMSSLKLGKKMMAAAHNGGSYHPILLTVSLIGTVPVPELTKHMSRKRAGKTKGLRISVRHQRILRNYLAFIFTRKMEKLLENLNEGLKDHFQAVQQLWTKASQGGLRYSKKEDGDTEDNPSIIGWQQFFDEYAYAATMEVEKRYYAMGPDSCVLTLYDGQLQSLQASLDALSTWDKFRDGVLQQLGDLGFNISEEEGDLSGDDNDDNDAAMTTADGRQSKSSRATTTTSAATTTTTDGDEGSDKRKRSNGEGRKRDESKLSPSKKRRNRKKNAVGPGMPPMDRPPAIKLHIGNLAYHTTPKDLFDYFGHLVGRDVILECHIPTTRDTNKSRGFGFVTVPEHVAHQILMSGHKHEIAGRLLRIAESNSGGPSRIRALMAQGPPPPPLMGDRCATCGYRPKYCVCPVPNIPGQHPPGGGPMDGMPPQMPPPGRDADLRDTGVRNASVEVAIGSAAAGHQRTAAAVGGIVMASTVVVVEAAAAAAETTPVTTVIIRTTESAADPAASREAAIVIVAEAANRATDRGIVPEIAIDLVIGTVRVVIAAAAADLADTIIVLGHLATVEAEVGVAATVAAAAAIPKARRGGDRDRKESSSSNKNNSGSNNNIDIALDDKDRMDDADGNASPSNNNNTQGTSGEGKESSSRHRDRDRDRGRDRRKRSSPGRSRSGRSRKSKKKKRSRHHHSPTPSPSRSPSRSRSGGSDDDKK
eukprot:CAMPEP_0119573780 /NCGR_PEP_ID=MMETSP1352-20130426/45295_1 /TAXON_ID=265584 /ORGANISM="Stauroneis constricta, Strain CCMP1120" /LENGTH=1383 /DNA_ID=CAMNT_0007623471 /DNA_START=736 /DNA_END=4887 /DNA_ORIENTATION=+